MEAMPPVERQAPGAAQLAADVAYWLLDAQDSSVEKRNLGLRGMFIGMGCPCGSPAGPLPVWPPRPP